MVDDYGFGSGRDRCRRRSQRRFDDGVFYEQSSLKREKEFAVWLMRFRRMDLYREVACLKTKKTRRVWIGSSPVNVSAIRVIKTPYSFTPKFSVLHCLFEHGAQVMLCGIPREFFFDLSPALMSHWVRVSHVDPISSK